MRSIYFDKDIPKVLLVKAIKASLEGCGIFRFIFHVFR